MITPRQQELLNSIRQFVETHGFAPTISEIQIQLGLRSPASVHHLLSELEKDGCIRRIPNARRGIELVSQTANEPECEIPLLGVIAAGYPIEAVLNQETISVPRSLLGRQKTFALRVRGNSMIDEQICNGDLIIVDSRSIAENGQTVVALVDHQEATVKRFYSEQGGQVRLEPANPEYQSIVVASERVQIQGVVIGLIRKYQR